MVRCKLKVTSPNLIIYPKIRDSYIIGVDLLGFGEIENSNSSSAELLNDVKRLEYMGSYLQALTRAMR